jgi:hypothetical protein
MASLIAAAAIGFRAAIAAIAWSAVPNFIMPERVFEQIVRGSIQAGSAVFWCWVTMALAGYCRIDSGWLERLGRLLGIVWITVALLFAYVYPSGFGV